MSEALLLAENSQNGFEHRSRPTLDHALRQGFEHFYHNGDVILPAHDAQPRLHYIVSGYVRWTIPGVDGQQKIVGICGPGDLLGPAWWPGATIAQTMVAYAIGSVQTCSWSLPQVVEISRSDPGFSEIVFNALATCIRMLSAHVETLSFCDAPQRVYRAFHELTERFSDPVPQGRRLRLRLTQTDIGEMANVSRVTVSKVYNAMKRKGVISKRNGYFTVHKPDWLREHATMGALARTSG